jgi:hypothetical protein
MSELDQLSEQVRRLVDREIGVARDELRVKARGALTGMALLAGAGVVGYSAGLAFLVAAIDLSRGRRPVWRGGLRVGLLLLGGAAGLAAAGVLRLREVDPVPRETLSSLEKAAERARRISSE